MSPTQRERATCSRAGGDAAAATDGTPAVERILRAWLEESDLTVFCGVWSNGAIMELVPRGRATLTGPLYAGDFAGLRDLLLDDGAHHVHLDLGRLSRACYVVAPSVCYGFRPSFELRIAVPDVDPVREFGLGLAVGQPYDGEGLRTPTARRYFARAAADMRAFPQTVSITFSAHTLPAGRQADWTAVERLLAADPELRHLLDHVPAGDRRT